MGDKKIILSIDDNAVQHKIFENILVPKYEVRSANSASSAMKYLNTDKADLILLDIEMPNITGFDFLYDIRKIPSYMEVPIIIVSGNTGQSFINQARASSAFDVLSKPVEKEVLAGTIEKALASMA